MDARYAINIADMTALDQFPVGIVVAPHIGGRDIIKPGRNPDDAAVVLECGAEQACAICILCATMLAERAHTICRIYHQDAPRRTWKRFTKTEIAAA